MPFANRAPVPGFDREKFVTASPVAVNVPNAFHVGKNEFGAKPVIANRPVPICANSGTKSSCTAPVNEYVPVAPRASCVVPKTPKSYLVSSIPVVTVPKSSE